MKEQYLIKEPADFQTIIKTILANDYKNEGAVVIALEGDLGAGKTTFVQELGKVLGVEEVITSPTFTIMKQYELSDGKFEKLIHIDAYRIESEDEIRPLQLAELMTSSKHIVCIEWPSQIKSILPKDVITISILINDKEERQVRVSQS